VSKYTFQSFPRGQAGYAHLGQGLVNDGDFQIDCGLNREPEVSSSCRRVTMPIEDPAISEVASVIADNRIPAPAEAESAV
jgi:hypothetical protein